MKIDITKNKVWFTSDPHFYHDFIIKACNRPFDSIEEMNETIISNWNGVVQDKDDHVFVLGDFAFTSRFESIQKIVNRLNGKIHLIFGNHDYQNKLTRNVIGTLFESSHDYLDLRILDPEMDDGEQRLFLCHYPMNSWAGSQRGSWNLFGHIHSPEYKYDTKYNPATLDVGVDAHNYTPISYEKVKELITQQFLYRKHFDEEYEKFNSLTKSLIEIYERTGTQV